MFGDHKRLERKLREGGAHATATVTAAKVTMSSGSGSGAELALDPNATFKYWQHLTVEVQPAGGSPFTAEFGTTWEHQLHPGQQVPVLYDPHDHSKIVLDHEQLEADGPAGGFGNVSIQVMSRDGRPAAAGDAGVEVQRGDDGTIRITRTTPSSQPGASPEDGRITALERLAQLHASGALSDEEFAAEKARLLGG